LINMVSTVMPSAPRFRALAQYARVFGLAPIRGTPESGDGRASPPIGGCWYQPAEREHLPLGFVHDDLAEQVSRLAAEFELPEHGLDLLREIALGHQRAFDTVLASGGAADQFFEPGLAVGALGRAELDQRLDGRPAQLRVFCERGNRKACTPSSRSWSRSPNSTACRPPRWPWPTPWPSRPSPPW
jgi:hypothetical protein